MKENFSLFKSTSENIDIDPIEIIEKDSEYLKRKLNFNFVADKLYEQNIFNLNENMSKLEKDNFLIESKSEDIILKNNKNEIIKNNSFKNMVLPINSDLIYVDDKYYSKKW